MYVLLLKAPQEAADPLKKGGQIFARPIADAFLMTFTRFSLEVFADNEHSVVCNPLQPARDNKKTTKNVTRESQKRCFHSADFAAAS